jgi:hypothetical protein
MSVQKAAVASQKFTKPGVTVPPEPATVAVKVTTVPEGTVAAGDKVRVVTVA